MGILLLSDGGLEGYGLLRNLDNLADLLLADAHGLGNLVVAGFAPELLEKLTVDPDELIDGLDHVYGDTDGARLIRDSTGDGLANPPCRIG